LFDLAEPQHCLEPLHLLNLIKPPFSPQVGLTVKAAPPGRHVRRRRARTWPCRSAPLLPPLSHALDAVRDADARRVG
jgi:hypothetical protein